MSQIPDSAILTATLPAMNQIWSEMRDFAQKVSYSRGSSIYPYEEKEASFYYISRGMLTILHGSEDGKTRDMMCMHSGSLLNVAHVLGSHLTSFLDTGCRFYCLTDTELWKFPGSLLHDKAFIRAHPEFITNVMETLGVRVLLMHNTLSYSLSGDAITKVARFCLNISHAYDYSLEIENPIQLGKLANLLGIHRISLFRVIKKLKGMGIIGEFSSERLEILDLPALKNMAMANGANFR